MFHTGPKSSHVGRRPATPNPSLKRSANGRPLSSNVSRRTRGASSLGKIYKYLEYDVLRLALSEEGLCSFRCSYPRDFNDPYELFLTLDFQKQEPELLAYYYDVIGDLPQYPVTCFSKAPDVIPMWAHYGHSHRGVVLEFDENEFSRHFTSARFGDVDYQNEPDESLEAILSRAFHIGKPRYHYFLMEGVLSAAYFTKQLCWEYEKERRLVLPEKDIKKTGEMMLVKFPTSCITSVISGRNSSDEDKEFGKRAADDIGALYYSHLIRYPDIFIAQHIGFLEDGRTKSRVLLNAEETSMPSEGDFSGRFCS